MALRTRMRQMRIQKPVALKEYPSRPPEQLVSEVEPVEVVAVVVVQSAGLGRICARVFFVVVVLTFVRKIADGHMGQRSCRGEVPYHGPENHVQDQKGEEGEDHTVEGHNLHAKGAPAAQLFGSLPSDPSHASATKPV